MQNLATLNVTGVVTQVAFPVFALIQDDPVRLKHSMRKAMTVLALVNFPILVGMALVARPLVYLLLTEKWAGCIPWLQLLCVAGLLYPFESLHLNVLKAKGRSDLHLRLEVLTKMLIVGAIAITYRWGVTGLIWGQIALSGLCYYINSYYTSRLIHYRLREQFLDLAPYAAVSAVMGAGVYLIQTLPFPGHALPLAAGDARRSLTLCHLELPPEIVRLPGDDQRRQRQTETADPGLASGIGRYGLSTGERQYRDVQSGGLHRPGGRRRAAAANRFRVEIVVGEDCSTDGTRAIVLEYQRKYPERLRVLTGPQNVGPDENLLRVWAASRGKYIAFCDGDDYWTDPRKLHKQVGFLEMHPDYALCCHDVEVVYERRSGGRRQIRGLRPGHVLVRRRGGGAFYTHLERRLSAQSPHDTAAVVQ